MSEPVVNCEIDGRGVATVSLNRPHVNNAYDGAMIAELLDIVGRLGADDGVRVLVLRGNGRHFQAGADLKWIDAVRRRDANHNLEVSRRTAMAVRGLNEFPRPTMALVHGGCFGGGVGMIAACDIVIAERSSMFSITEARWGLTASIIVPQLNGAMGARQVRRYALSCERFDAERAERMGLVHELCEPGQLASAAAPVIDALLASEPGAVALTKRFTLEQAGLVMSDDELERLVSAHATARRSRAAEEGLASFLEKRPAAWYPGKVE